MQLNELEKLLASNPLWYKEVFNEIKHIELLKNKRQQRSKHSLLLKGVSRYLKENKILFGETGYNWDQWRKPIDSIVIHHTSLSPTTPLNTISAIHLLNMYVKQYSTDDDVINQPIYSGHYWFKKPRILKNMTFASYHYLIRPNGKLVQLVEDSSYLWHAANLEINRSSIGIVFAGDFMKGKEPTELALNACANLIKQHYAFIDRSRIYGHKEVANHPTECPGDTFINCWKNKILEKL